MANAEALASAYLTAKWLLIERGFCDEIDWQDARSPRSVTDDGFLREYAWVVLSCGLAERVVRRIFGGVSESFCDWDIRRIGLRGIGECARRASELFDHNRKIAAVASVARRFVSGELSAVKMLQSEDFLSQAKTLPFIGPVTAFHLAKNVGMSVCKPDRHLMRLAAALGYEDPLSVCEAIVRLTGERIAVVDVVLWRYLSLTADYSLQFEAGAARVEHTANLAFGFA